MWVCLDLECPPSSSRPNILNNETDFAFMYGFTGHLVEMRVWDYPNVGDAYMDYYGRYMLSFYKRAFLNHFYFLAGSSST